MSSSEDSASLAAKIDWRNDSLLVKTLANVGTAGSDIGGIVGVGSGLVSGSGDGAMLLIDTGGGETGGEGLIGCEGMSCLVSETTLSVSSPETI